MNEQPVEQDVAAVQTDRIEQIITQSIQREEIAFRNYLKVYELSNPRPSFGWYVRISAIAMVALMLVAALRTSFSFGLSAFTSLNQFLKDVLPNGFLLTLSGFEALCAVLGIEGFIVTTGMKGSMNKKEEDLTSSRAIAAYLLLLVSCVAGLFQNSALIADPQTVKVIEWILMIVTGVGIPIAIMFAAPYLGLMLNFQAIQNARWLNEAREKFESSKERKLARRDLMAEQTNVTRQEEPVQIHQQQELPRVAEIVAWYRQAFNGDEY
jgi:hypothetical protein